MVIMKSSTASIEDLAMPLSYHSSV